MLIQCSGNSSYVGANFPCPDSADISIHVSKVISHTAIRYKVAFCLVNGYHTLHGNYQMAKFLKKLAVMFDTCKG